MAKEVRYDELLIRAHAATNSGRAFGEIIIIGCNIELEIFFSKVYREHDYIYLYNYFPKINRVLLLLTNYFIFKLYKVAHLNYSFTLIKKYNINIIL